MIVTIARVTDPDRFMEIFETIGEAKRREHGCRGARAYFDPDDPHRVWSVFDWDAEDYEGFLADPDIPAIARELKLQSPPVLAVAAIELEA
ncbi:antibiotic biosynthesis monooxygenase [Pseudonocardia sp. TRM90224]|uniref:antibiotic biosynthesis monooxygenase n=1 Tax=Pseudonocardia sp. TRM90224 TaxID=2812678 RepID=UPI001E5CD798|nr:antibiotic biosynthesis monooxygenase [Pseudonocardia sp. TRM90224]